MPQSQRMTPQEARTFDRYSVANAVLVETVLECGCKAYEDVFTYRRWKAQGYQVQRGEKATRLPMIAAREEKDEQTGEVKVRRFRTRSAVFCRHQVRRVES